MRYLVEVFDRQPDGEKGRFLAIRNKIAARSIEAAFTIAEAMEMANHDTAVLVSVHVPRHGWMYVHVDDIQGTLDDVNAALSQALHDVKNRERNQRVKAVAVA